MVRAIRIVLNGRGMREVLKSDEVGDQLLQRAERVAAQARSIAPVDTGAYKSSIYAEVHDGPSRVVGRAGARVPYAQVLEARRRVLGRAFDAAGGN